MKYRDAFFFDMALMYSGSMVSVARNLNCVIQDKLPIDVVNKDAVYYDEHRESITNYCM